MPGNHHHGGRGANDRRVGWRAGRAGKGGSSDGTSDKAADRGPTGVAVVSGRSRKGGQKGEGNHSGETFGIHNFVLLVSVG
jgi:hypothetical protein